MTPLRRRTTGPTSPFRDIDIHENVVAVCPDGERRVMLGMADFVRSRADVELQSMPGASEKKSLEFSLAKRAARVGTKTVEGVEDSVNIAQRDNAVPCNDFATFSGGAILDRCDANPMRHGFLRRASAVENNRSCCFARTRTSLGSRP